MPEPTFLRAVLADYFHGAASFGVVCAVWKRSFYESYHALLDAGLRGAEGTPENIDKLYQILRAVPPERPGQGKLCQGCIHLERRWVLGMTWCALEKTPRDSRANACILYRGQALKEKP